MDEGKHRYVTYLASLMRKDAYGKKTEEGYSAVHDKLHSSIIERHVDGGQPIGAYPLKRGEVEVAVLDLDDHDGSFGWPAMTAKAAEVTAAAIQLGLKPHAFRSGGGSGIHLWFTWEKPQQARLVRHLLRTILASAGLKEGATGVKLGTAEIFPKQDRVEEGGLGNLIALPGARASVPLLSDTLEQVGWETIDLAEAMMRYSAPPPAVAEEERAPAAYTRLDDDDAEVANALKVTPSDDYGDWVRVALALKHTFGEDGFPLFEAWSEKSDKSPGPDKLRKFWDGLKPNGDVGLGTIFYLAKQHGWNGPRHPMVREMNARFGILTVGNNTQIIVKNGDRHPDDDQPFLSKQVFIDRLEPEALISRDEAGGETRKSKARTWLSHRNACHYTRVDFDPSLPPGHNGKTWNLWTGFGVEPRPGDWSLLQEHILANICGGDQKLSDWLLNWMAIGIQKPGEPTGTAPVLVGLPGTGKGVLAHAYGRLWGGHYITVTHAEHVTGRFSGHLLARRFVFIDEGTFGGNRKEAGMIKTRITEPYLVVERKGVDAMRMKNRMIFMIASNEASVVPADKHDRRWLVFDVGDDRREDRGYFGAIQRQMDAGGYGAMLHDLLRRDIELGPDPRRIIKTAALFEQVLLAGPPEVRYVHGVLDQGRLPQNWLTTAGSTTIKAMLLDLRQNHREATYVDLIGLGRQIRKMVPSARTAPNGRFFVMKDQAGEMIFERSTRYDFPSLPEARRDFERFIGMAVPWSADVEAWQTDPDREGECDEDDVI